MTIRLTACLAATTLLAACSHPRPAAVTPVAARDTTPPRPVATMSTAPAPTHADSLKAEIARDGGPGITAGRWGVAGPDSALLAQPLHFDFNEAELTPAEIAKLDAKREVLERHPALKIRIAGNADERGPDEYNLALGLRRAAAAKRWLTFHGIAAGRIEIVSYGEEQPVDDAHTEEAWRLNRRDDFLSLDLGGQ